MSVSVYIYSPLGRPATRRFIAERTLPTQWQASKSGRVTQRAKLQVFIGSDCRFQCFTVDRFRLALAINTIPVTQATRPHLEAIFNTHNYRALRVDVGPQECINPTKFEDALVDGLATVSPLTNPPTFRRLIVTTMIRLFLTSPSLRSLPSAPCRSILKRLLCMCLVLVGPNPVLWTTCSRPRRPTRLRHRTRNPASKLWFL